MRPNFKASTSDDIGSIIPSMTRTMATITEPKVHQLSEDMDDFHHLVKDLSDVLGTCSGLDSADTDANEIVALMESYVSKTTEWQKYALVSA